MSSKEGIRINRKAITFLFCVLASLFFWLMMTLSKEYTIVVNFPVKYINFPVDKVIANHLPETIDIEIESSGFSLLIYKFKKQRDEITMDIKDVKPLALKNHFYLLGNSRVDKITAQFNSDIHIVRVYPDTVFLNFNKKITKTVPVKYNLKMEFQDQYQQRDSVILTPHIIDIAGAADVVEKISYLETVPMELKNVNKSLSLKLSILQTKDLKFIELSHPSVQATVNVTKYTEATIDLSLEVENLPLGFGLKTFPDKINVKYNVAFDNYEKINSTMFRAIVDYKKIEIGSNKLKVQLVKYPQEIKAVKINPEKVEYIIKK